MGCLPTENAILERYGAARDAFIEHIRAEVSQATADVTGFAVAFYVQAGTLETGSDQEPTGDSFITAGQSLSWAVIEDHTVHGYGDDPNQQVAQTGDIPADATSCRFLQWYTGGQ